MDFKYNETISMSFSFLYFKGLLVKLRGPDEMLFYKDGDNTALTSGTRHALKPAVIS